MTELRVLLVSLLAAFSAPTSKAQFVKDWNAVSTEHFELVSRYDPANMGKLIQELEWVRAVFIANLGFEPKNDRAVLIYLPDSPYDYEQTSPSRHSDGYYLGAPFRDLIVLRSFAHARTALFHEYTHLMVRHRLGLHVPGWFSEGTAEYYAMMRKTKDGVEAGVPNSARLRVLKSGFWLPVSYMVDTETPASLPSPDAMQKFYAQASVYAHMLHLSPSYREGLQPFSELLAGTASTEEGLRRVYSKSPLEFDSDARAWFRQNKLPTERLQAPAEGNWIVKTRKITPLEEQLARITVASAGPRRAQAKTEYTRLSRLAGDDCAFQAALGDLAYAGGLASEAAARYEQAERCGIKVTAAIEALAGTGVRRGGTRMEKRRTEVEAREDPDRTHFLNGTGQFFENNFEAAVKEFEKVNRLLQPDQFRMTRLKALALARLGRFEGAEGEAGQLAMLASDTEQRQSAQMTLDDVRAARQSAQTPPEPPHKALLRKLTRVEGELVRVDCRGSRAIFWIREGKDTRKLILAEPSDLVTGPEGSPPLEFACGPQRRRVIIGYQAQPDLARGTAGHIRYLEFR